MPAVTEPRGATHRLRAVPTDPDRSGFGRVDDRESRRWGPHGAHPVLRVRRPVVVAGTEHLELAAEVTDADAEDQPVTGEAAERARHRRHHQRVAVGRDEHIGPEPQSAGDAEPPGTGGERLEERRGEVHRRRVIGDRHVVREPHRFEAQLLAGPDELTNR